MHLLCSLVVGFRLCLVLRTWSLQDREVHQDWETSLELETFLRQMAPSQAEDFPPDHSWWSELCAMYSEWLFWKEFSLKRDNAFNWNVFCQFENNPFYAENILCGLQSKSFVSDSDWTSGGPDAWHNSNKKYLKINIFRDQVCWCDIREELAAILYLIINPSLHSVLPQRCDFDHSTSQVIWQLNITIDNIYCYEVSAARALSSVVEQHSIAGSR